MSTRIKQMKIIYTDDTDDTFRADDNPNGYEDKHRIRRDDWLSYAYVEDGALLRLDTQYTHAFIPVVNIKRVSILEVN